jgi:hypothetical protein
LDLIDILTVDNVDQRDSNDYWYQYSKY